MPKSAVQAEQATQEKAAFDELSKLRERLDPIAHKILAANADLCDKTKPDIGVITQTAKSFPKELRAGARRDLGLTDDPIVVYVRPDGPGDKAGIRPGDKFFGENGIMSSSGKVFKTHLKSGLTIERERGEVREQVIFEPETKCDFGVQLKMTSAINAYANGKSIIMTAGMMNFVQSDDELAYIIGHELAHNTQSHIRKSITNYVLSLGGTRYTRKFESEADYVGIYYMERAGYDASGVEDIWRRLARMSLRPIGRAKTHPAYPSRTVQIKATREEIEAKRASGADLLPEPKEKS